MLDMIMKCDCCRDSRILIMGCGSREVTLEVFESYLKKLLHMIDKLPSQDKDKAVMILKNSANQYYNLTFGQQPLEFLHPSSSYQQHIPSTTTAVETPQQYSYDQHQSQNSRVEKLESEAILEEISDLTGASCLGDDNHEHESWDRHFETHPGVCDLEPVSSIITPKCALCSKLFSVPSEVAKHYQPVSCIGCKKELCNYEIFNIHYHSCKGIKHYQSKLRSRHNIEATATSSTAAMNLQNKPSETEKSKKQSFKCPECSKIFFTAFQLNKHMKGHSDNNCDKCSEKFAKRRLLVQHLKTVHFISTAEKYYPCKYCPRKFVKKPSLWTHYSEHTTGSQVVCLKCGKMLENEDSLKQHMDQHRANARHTCDKCGDFFVRKQQYLVHMKGHEKYNCKTCGKDFSSKKKLKLHRSSEHDPNSNNSNNKPRVEKNKLLLNEKNPNFTCVVCLQNYKNETLFKAHDCSKDSKKSRTAGEKKVKVSAKDVAIKLTGTKYKCRFCDFENKKSAVVRHARVHRNKKRFVCELCGSAFNAHYTLKEHRIYVHSEDRKFQCNKCDKTFKAKNALIRHEQVHSDRRPFSCHCGQMFKRGSHLKRHLATAHKGETVPNNNVRSTSAATPAAPAPPDPEQDYHLGSSPDKHWLDPADSRYKSGWEINQKHSFNTSAAIPASVALDVVTSLDLNMRHLDTSKQEKPEKLMSKQSVHHDRYRGEARDSSSVYHSYYHPQTSGAKYHGHSSGQSDRLHYYDTSLHDKYHSGQEKLYVSPPLNHPPVDPSERGYLARADTDPTLFSDSGPADLTMTRSPVSAVSREQQYNRGHRSSQPGRYAQFPPHGSRSYHHHHSVYPSTRPGHQLTSPDLDTFNTRVNTSLDYRQQQYFDQYLPREPDNSSPDKKKYVKSDKYYSRSQHLDQQTRDEGGLLPPLLALAPQQSSQTSPGHNIKLDYLQSDQMSHQYIPDPSIDYNNISEY